MPRWPVLVLSGVVAVVAFAVGIVVGAGPGRSWALGNLPEWVTALGLVVAAAALFHQARESRDEQEVARRAQAEAVTFYRVPEHGETKIGPGRDPNTGLPDLLERLTYVVVNGSALPVTEVEVLVMFPPDDRNERAQQLRYGVVKGNDPDARPTRDVCWFDSYADEYPMAWLGFTDTAGRRWSRPLDGSPQRSGEAADDPTGWEQGLCNAIGLCRVRPIH